MGISVPREIGGLYCFTELVGEIGMQRTCNILDVKPDTVKRWLRGHRRIPQMAVVALYWESFQARSMIYHHHRYELQLAFSYIRAMEDVNKGLSEQISKLKHLRIAGANDPFFQSSEPTRAYPAHPYETRAKSPFDGPADLQRFGQLNAASQPSFPQQQALQAIAEIEARSSESRLRKVG